MCFSFASKIECSEKDAFWATERNCDAQHRYGIIRIVMQADPMI